ncbi:MAG: P-II family nitrogen regulator [Anaeroplasmataceae bacterium]|nr:P-II family nitrogen regulator [Anaeroplasmataceae bacterium]HRF70531.1 P-II family nitrogen regulator [Candidatus Pelethenecus sp.]
MDNQFELVFCIVNAGFSDSVMSAVREIDSRIGGTVLNARGTAREEAEKLFNISIQPEKEILMILVKKAVKEDVLHAIYKNVGLNTPGQGIAFSIPVDEVVGLSSPTLKQEPKPEN